MKLGTKLAISLSLIIMIVFSGYGYFHSHTRREILVRLMKVETRSIGQTLKASLERFPSQTVATQIQDIIDAVEAYEKTAGILLYDQRNDVVFKSQSLEEDLEPFVELVKRSSREDRAQEEFGSYHDQSVFAYAFPLKNQRGQNIGGAAILQHTLFVEKDVRRAKGMILFSILILIGIVVILILLMVRRSINQPIARLTEGINRMAEGHLDTQIDFRRGDELSELAQAFNRMALELKEAHGKILQDAEMRLELERHLRQSEKLAAIGQLASGLAHEVGTPLNIIGGRAELTKKRLDERAVVQKNLDIILQQVERITKIIQQLLGFVRKKRPERMRLNVNPLLETTLDFLDHQIQKQGVTVTKRLAEEPPWVVGDPDQLQQVLLNFLLNAIQSMPTGGRLFVSTSSRRVSRKCLENGEQEYVEVRVDDTGMGMEKEMVETIFDPFFSTKPGGTGLGLTVSQGIVQEHEGWIEVESERGKGSSFKVYLPARRSEVQVGA